MTLTDQWLTRRRLRAPTEHGTALIDPPLVEAARLVDHNRRLAAEHDVDVQGRSLSRLSREARQELIDQARQYTSAYREVAQPADGLDRPVLLAGHQPQLFHPGVWFKCFALDRLGKELGAHAVHLLVDNDALASPSIRVPTGSLDDPRIEHVALDGAAAALPFEQRPIVDQQLVRSFAQRTCEVIRPFVPRPLVARMWEPIDEILRQTDNLGCCVAQARHRLEGQLGLSTLELPLSRVCDSNPFRWFVSHLLAQLPRLWEVYNTSLAEYRRVNRVRSRTHPAAELASEDGWLEAPLWVWTSDDGRRRPLLARPCREGIELSDRHQLRACLPLDADQDADRAVERLAELRRQGVKVRPRALITTMYARLVLGDLFVHGIGGAKYDELTDAIIRRFFQREAPALMSLSATVLLPIKLQPVRPDQLRQVEHQLRELRFHPERYLDDGSRGDGQVARLVQEKRRWIAQQLPRGQRRKRHEQICRINEALQGRVGQWRRRLEQQRQVLSEQLRKRAILGSREFSFCLFPEDSLVPLLLELLEGAA